MQSQTNSRKKSHVVVVQKQWDENSIRFCTRGDASDDSGLPVSIGSAGWFHTPGSTSAPPPPACCNIDVS
jgi:hypothetical protein